MRFYTDKEPGYVNETTSHNFALVAACGDISNRPGGRDNFRQAVLAKRGWTARIQRERLAERIELCVRVRQKGTTFPSRDEGERWQR